MYGVVGGGLAGLSAAGRLRETGHAVRVFEASDWVGGRARTVDTGGGPVERFPHYLSPTADAVPSLATDLGLGERVVRRSGRTARYRDGVVHRLDAPWERLAYPGTGLVDAARARRLARAVRSLDDAGTDASADLDATTVEAFVVDRASRAAYEGYVEPALGAEFGDRAGDVSAAWLAAWLRSREERDRTGTTVDVVDGSMARLTDALVEAIGEGAIRTGNRVIGIDSGVVADAGSGSAVSLTVETPAGREVADCEGVVVADGPSTLRDVTRFDTGMEAVPEVCALLTTDEPIVDSWRVTVEPGALSGGEDAPFGTLFGHTNLLPPERYGGDHLTYLVGRGRSIADGGVGGEDDGGDGTDENLRERWLSALEDLFPAFSREGVRSFRVARDPAAAVAAPPGGCLPVDLGEVGLRGVAYAGPGSRIDRFGGSPDARVAAGVAAAEAVADAGTTGSAGTTTGGSGTDASPSSAPERDGSGFEWG